MTFRFLAECAPVQHAILSAAALLVPHAERKEWLAEWRSELWYVRAAHRRDGTAFCLGAFQDALWFGRNNPPPNAQRNLRLTSSLSCGLVLTILAGVSLFFALQMPGTRCGESFIREQLIIPHLLVVFIALLILPGTTSIELGEYPAIGYSVFWRNRFRRWIFFCLKVILILAIVFCSSLNLVSLGLAPIWPQALLAGYVVAFRWALLDQRRRCPVCLRLLTNPVQIGQPSQTFLAWYGTELICVNGHGLLHVPEIPTSWCSKQRWLDLDSSWNSLFSSRDGDRTRDPDGQPIVRM